MRDRYSALNRIATWAIFAAVMTGAAACQSNLGGTGTENPGETPAATPLPVETAAAMPTADLSALTLWVPPAFRSDGNSPAGELLNRRIDAYEALHPGITVVVRIKAANGDGGLRDSLSAASAAAPGSMPDLVALDQSNLHAAAIKELIHPLDGLLPADAWDSYFPYARSMVTVDGHMFGVPFAGDAIILAGTLMPYPAPRRWTDTGNWTSPMFAPLADSRALFLFFGYYAAGGTPLLSVADTRIEPEALARTLAWLQAMQEGGVLNPRSLQLESFESAFLAIESVGDCAVTLYSIVSKASDYYIGHMPTPEGEAFSLSTGWAWAVATSDPDRQIIAADLMTWLTDPEFLAEWSATQGVLPPARPAMEQWASGARRDLASSISESSFVFPDDEILVFAGPVFSKAARRVLLDGISPADSAQEAAKAIHPG
ncbi:MAG: extracellular solute-binding protein [Anaerolineales bacterium]|nr:extracellular solute-binding protein [Anaerolineales bacterium]